MVESTAGWRQRWEQRFGLDVRSLALFRVLMGLLILADLATRLPHLRAFMTDDGFLPRADLLDRVATSSTPYRVSIHAMSGLFGVELVLFALAAFCAVMLILGHRTRLFTIASWLLLMSLQNRNPAVLNAGDALMRLLLFWSIFLPLGARWSIDSAMNTARPADPADRDNRHWSIPALCFMAQVTIIYWATALLKHDPIWTEERTAVWHALKLDYMSLPLADVLRSLPPGLLEFFAPVTLVVEFVVPLLIWVPFFVAPLRLLAIFLMVGMHVTFMASLQIGLFSYVCCAMWLALLPSWFWDTAGRWVRRDERRTGLTMWYDGTCGFCRRMVLVIRELCLLPETRIERAQDDEVIERRMLKHNSWVVIGADKSRHYKFEALGYVLRRSPWAWPLGMVMALPPIEALGRRGYQWIANNRDLMGRLSGWVRPWSTRPPSRVLLVVRGVVLLGTLAYVLAWNANGLHDERAFAPESVPGRLAAACDDWLYERDHHDRRWYGYLLRIGQKWSMFAPAPRRSTAWFVAVGTLDDGSEVDLYRHVVLGEDAPPVSWDRPPKLIDTYRGPRWRKYMMLLRRDGGREHRSSFCKYLAREWERDGAGALERVELWVVTERIKAYEENGPSTPRRLWYYTP